ncbi:unnamed protein product [Linum trigynum]|uniref:Uncharacterized protein n=1 Tax=Linum trigynum TaxID=586398 RepID=A0AAV2DJC8_9ROSI
MIRTRAEILGDLEAEGSGQCVTECDWWRGFENESGRVGESGGGFSSREMQNDAEVKRQRATWPWIRYFLLYSLPPFQGYLKVFP